MLNSPTILALEFADKVDRDIEQMIDTMADTIAALHKRAEEMLETKARKTDLVYHHVRAALRTYVSVLIVREPDLRLKVLEKLQGDESCQQ